MEMQQIFIMNEDCEKIQKKSHFSSLLFASGMNADVHKTPEIYRENILNCLNF